MISRFRYFQGMICSRYYRLIKVALLLVLLVLAKFILFKKSPGYYKHYFAKEYRQYAVRDGWRKANLEPFVTITLFSKHWDRRTDYKMENLGGNIIGFIPVGFLLCFLIRNRYRYLSVFLLTAAISLGFELIQLFTGLGSFDVDDILLNTTGGILGILIFIVFQVPLRRSGTLSAKR